MEQLKVRKSLLTQWYFTLHVSFTCMLPQHLEINYIFIQDTTSHFFYQRVLVSYQILSFSASGKHTIIK